MLVRDIIRLRTNREVRLTNYKKVCSYLRVNFFQVHIFLHCKMKKFCTSVFTSASDFTSGLFSMFLTAFCRSLYILLFSWFWSDSSLLQIKHRIRGGRQKKTWSDTMTFKFWDIPPVYFNFDLMSTKQSREAHRSKIFASGSRVCAASTVVNQSLMQTMFYWLNLFA